MAVGGEVTPELLAAAAAPVCERLEALKPTLPEPLRRVVDHLRANFLRPELRVGELFSASGGTRGNSSKTRFTVQLGLAPREFLEACRLEVALRLLRATPSLPARAVAEASGYGSESTFHVAFKRCLGAGLARVRSLFASGLLKPASLEPRHVCEALAGLAIAPAGPAPGSKAAAQLEAGEGEGQAALEARLFHEVLRDWLHTAPESELRELGSVGFQFKTPALFMGLLRLSREGCRHDRKLGVRIAEAAQDALEAVADQLSAEEHANLKVQGLAWLANAHRLASEWVEADAVFREAEVLLTGHPVSSETEATYLLNKGFFRTVQHRLSESVELLDRACLLCTSLPEPVRLSEALLARGHARFLKGLVAQAVDDFHEAWRLLERLDPPQTYLSLSAAGHLAEAQWAVGAIDEAARYVETARHLAMALGLPAMLGRHLWLEGLLAGVRGNHTWADRCLRQARATLLCSGEASSAALLALDIAALNLERGYFEAAEHFTKEALPALEALVLDEAAMAALALLRAACVAHALTPAAINPLRKGLEGQLAAPAWRPPASSGR